MLNRNWTRTGGAGMLLVGGLLSSLAALAAEPADWDVLPDAIEGVAAGDMMRHYLLQQVNATWQRWQEDYEKVKTPEALAERERILREKFVAALGGFPERTPLNPQVTGVLKREGYRVEKILFESQPKFYVSAALFLPESDRFKPPYPGVLVPCGHAEKAKAHDEYQSVGALLALNGMAALVFDPIDQGERMQLVDAGGKYTIHGTKGHTMAGIGCMLTGRNTARIEVWDGMRALDYLTSRPEVDPERIGCTGNSGGGTQTSYLMSLDDRIKAAAVSCYIHRESRELELCSGDAEQNIYGQLAFGMEHGDYLMMRAPMPILLCAATEDFFDIKATWETFRYAKRMFTRLGVPERIDILENDERHNYNRTQREGVARWMARWLCGRCEEIVEPELKLFTPEELWASPKGQVLLMDGARNVYDLNADCEQQLAEGRKALWASEKPAALLERVRAVAGIRKLAELPRFDVPPPAEVRLNGFRAEKIVLSPEAGLWLPGLLAHPESAKANEVALLVNGTGKDPARIEALLKEGVTVFAVDLRGMGETRQIKQKAMGEDIALDWEDLAAAYALGRSYVGMRAEDVLVCARYAAERLSARQVRLIAVGQAGVPALHAAALEPELFSSIQIEKTLVSWSNVVRMRPTYAQLANAVQGALEVYDLPDLAATLGSKLRIEAPVDAMEKPVQ